MIIQRRFAPISGRFEPELLAGLAGIYSLTIRIGLCNDLAAKEAIYAKDRSVSYYQLKSAFFFIKGFNGVHFLGVKMKIKSVILTFSLCALFLIFNNYVKAQPSQKQQLTKEQIEAFRSAKTVRIVVDQSYKNDENNEIKGVSLPIEDILRKFLKCVGLQAVNPDTKNYDLEVKARIRGFIRSNPYENKKVYNVAIIMGVIFIEFPNIAIFSKSIGASINLPPLQIQESIEDYYTPSTILKNKDLAYGFYGLESSIARIMVEVYGISPFLAQLKDEDAANRKFGVFVLGSTGDPQVVVEPLIKCLKDDDTGVRRETAFFLGLIRDSKAVRPLILTLKDNDKEVRSMTVDALGSIEDPQAVEPLIKCLKDKDRDVRRLTAWALSDIGDPSAVEPLINCLKDDDSSVRDAVARALEEMTGEDFGVDRKEWEKWWRQNKKEILKKK